MGIAAGFGLLFILFSKISIAAFGRTETAGMFMNLQLFFAVAFHFGKMLMTIITFKNEEFNLSVVFNFFILRADDFLGQHSEN